MKKSYPKRGFASMDPAKHREIASKGGKAAHAAGTAHQFTSDEAREAGRKGGTAVVAKHGSDYMAAIGKIGDIRLPCSVDLRPTHFERTRTP